MLLNFAVNKREKSAKGKYVLSLFICLKHFIYIGISEVMRTDST